MKVIREPDAMQRYAFQQREVGKCLGLVPTMGFLHEGHLSLVKQSRERDDVTIVSIFVNPIQFVQGEDLAAYPRDEARDLAMLAAEGVHAVFFPRPETMYPPNYATRVIVDGPSRGWCGEVRPGHFAGVATICTMLFNLCLPHRAYFGQKDAQQVEVVKRFVRDLHIPVEIVVGPTIREPDGLAKSSRNVYLQSDERKAARVLSRSLWEVERAFEAGERNGSILLALLWSIWEHEPLVRGQYAGIVNPETMQSVDIAQAGDRILVAAFVGKARLIDNWRLGDPPPDGIE